jgi:hypothetical protein
MRSSSVAILPRSCLHFIQIASCLFYRNFNSISKFSYIVAFHALTLRSAASVGGFEERKSLPLYQNV